MYSDRFPTGHRLNERFMHSYILREEIGSGGYGFVMVASRRGSSVDVAVKFIIRKKVPVHAWVQDSKLGRLPTEIWLLSRIRHPNIADFLEYFEDDVYYYLVQELHGSPWVSKRTLEEDSPCTSRNHSVPGLSSSFSTASTADSVLLTPMSPQSPTIDVFESQLFTPTPDEGSLTYTTSSKAKKPASRRRASHDLFECIEQSPGKRLPEHQAKFVFRQVVEAVWYLNRQGIIHCDIKDENILVDVQLRVKLIDFGSAVIEDPSKPRPFYDVFYGTTAYASSEVLRKRAYRAGPAEVWTLGVLLSYLLTGSSPFPTESDAIEGRVRLKATVGRKLSPSVLGLMKICLEPEPDGRATIEEVRNHGWLVGE